jgi:hypothetical protein
MSISPEIKIDSNIDQIYWYTQIISYNGIIDKYGHRSYRCRCLICGKFFNARIDNIKLGYHKSCGCYHDLYKQLVFKKYKRNPDLTDKERKSKKSYRLHKKIKERDNYTCQLTHKTNVDLDVHHIESWNRNEKKRFDPNNLITLDKRIHVWFHQLFGYGNNTKKQLDEFKQLYLSLDSIVYSIYNHDNDYIWEESFFYDF